MGFRNSLEWQLGSVKSEAIVFLTHGCFLTGQRERYVTVYPFANMILNGHLANNPSFSNFLRNEMFIFCNFRPKGNCRPDLLAFSSRGDVFLVEGKQRKRDQENNALQTLREGIKELKGYSYLLKEFARESSQAPYECWKSVYHNCYVKDEKHGFPELNSLIGAATPLHDPKDIKELFRKINDNVMHGRISFGFAFNDPDDVEPFFPLDSFDLMPPTTIVYKTNPTGGVKNLGYFKIDNTKIYNIVKDSWDKSLGRLLLFGIDKYNNNLRLLDPI